MDSDESGISGEPTFSGEPIEGAPQDVSVIEGYQILGKLSEQGAQGTIWRAVQLSTSREVALKVLRPGTLGSQSRQLRFEREVELAAGLEHPNIARIYDSGVHRGTCYYAMELIDGAHLDEHVTSKKLGPRDILHLVANVCEAMQYAHQRGIIHRDLKPSNILVSRDGQPHVVDFGLAKALGPERDEPLVTLEGQIAGTPAFMSPEQAAGRIGDLDTRTDVYSLGVILFRLLTGEYPHAIAGASADLLRRISEEEVRRPREVSKEVDAELEAVLLKALAHDREERYASAGELAADLRNYLAGEPLAARKPTTWYFLRKRARKHRVPIAVASAVLAVLAAMAVLAYVRVSAEKNRAEDQKARALTAAAEAERQRKDADAQRVAAQTAEEQSRRRLINSYVDAGWKLYDEGDTAAALLWHVEALNLELAGPRPTDARAERIHRIRIHEVLREVPVLETRIPGRGYVSSIVFSSDGRRLVAAGMSGVRVYEADTGKELLSLADGVAETAWAEFSSDRCIVTLRCVHREDAQACADEVRVWEAESGRPVTPPIIHGGAVWHTAFSPDGTRLLTAGQDGAVRLWDARTGTPAGETASYGYPVFYARFSADGKSVVVPSIKGVGLWQGHSTEPVSYVWNLRHPQSAVSLTSNGASLAHYGPRCLTVIVQDTMTGAVTDAFLYAVGPGAMGLEHVEFSPDGQKIVASHIGGASLYSRRRAKLFGRLYDTRSIRYGAFSPDGKRLVTASDSGAICVHLLKERVPDQLFPHTDCCAVALSFDQTRVATGSFGHEGFVRVWDANTGAIVTGLPIGLAEQGLGFLGLSYDGTLVATSSKIPWKTTRVCKVGTGEELMSFPNALIWFGPTGNHFLVATTEDLRLYDSATGETVRRFEGSAKVAAVSSNGCLVAASSIFKSGAKVWDARNSKPMNSRMYASDERVWYLALSPDGTLLATVGNQNNCRVWDVKSGRCIVPPLDLGGYARGMVTFSPDGRRIATASGGLRVWDALSGRPLTPMLEPLPRGGVGSLVTFSPDGKMIAASLLGGRVWDVETARPITPVLDQRDCRGRVLFSKNGSRLMTVCTQGAAFWDLVPDERPIQDLEMMARVFSSRRIDNGAVVALRPEEHEALFRELKAKYPNGLR